MMQSTNERPPLHLFRVRPKGNVRWTNRSEGIRMNCPLPWQLENVPVVTLEQVFLKLEDITDEIPLTPNVEYFFSGSIVDSKLEVTQRLKKFRKYYGRKGSFRLVVSFPYHEGSQAEIELVTDSLIFKNANDKSQPPRKKRRGDVQNNNNLLSNQLSTGISEIESDSDSDNSRMDVQYDNSTPNPTLDRTNIIAEDSNETSNQLSPPNLSSALNYNNIQNNTNTVPRDLLAHTDQPSPAPSRSVLTESLVVGPPANTNVNHLYSGAAPNHVNIAFFVPNKNEVINQMKEVLTSSLHFTKEAQSGGVHLFSRKRTLIEWHLLLVQYKNSDYMDCRDYIAFANEAVLGIILPEELYQGNSHNALMLVSKYTSSTGETSLDITDGFPADCFDFRANDYRLIQIMLSILTTAKSSREFFDPLRLGAYCSPSNFEAESWQDLVDVWCATCKTKANYDMFFCFKYTKSEIETFTEQAKAAIAVVKPIPSTDPDIVVHGSILLYATCSNYTPWYLLLKKQEIYLDAQRQGLELHSIYEACIADVEESMNRPDNAEFREELEALIERMRKNNVPYSLTDRFEITFPQLTCSIVLKIGSYLPRDHDETSFALTCKQFHSQLQLKKHQVNELMSQNQALEDYIATREQERGDHFSCNRKLHMLQSGMWQKDLETLKRSSWNIYGQTYLTDQLEQEYLTSDPVKLCLLYHIWDDDSYQVEVILEEHFQNNLLELLIEPLGHTTNWFKFEDWSILHYIVRNHAIETLKLLRMIIGDQALTEILLNPIHCSLVYLASLIGSTEVLSELLDIVKQNTEAKVVLHSHFMLMIVSASLHRGLDAMMDQILPTSHYALFFGHVDFLRTALGYYHITSAYETILFLIEAATNTIVYNKDASTALLTAINTARLLEVRTWPIVYCVIEFNWESIKLDHERFMVLCNKYHTCLDESHLEEDLLEEIRLSKDSLVKKSLYDLLEEEMELLHIAPNKSKDAQPYKISSKSVDIGSKTTYQETDPPTTNKEYQLTESAQQSANDRNITDKQIQAAMQENHPDMTLFHTDNLIIKGALNSSKKYVIEDIRFYCADNNMPKQNDIRDITYMIDGIISKALFGSFEEAREEYEQLKETYFSSFVTPNGAQDDFIIWHRNANAMFDYIITKVPSVEDRDAFTEERKEVALTMPGCIKTTLLQRIQVLHAKK